MLFRNSFKLLLENFKNVYKILLYKFIVSIIFLAICSAMLLPPLLDLINSEPVQALVHYSENFIKALFVADATELSAIQEAVFSENGALYQVGKLLVSEALGIILAVVGCLVAYLLKRYADAMCSFTVGSVLNDKMSTYAETSFFSVSIANLGKASAYALFYVPFSFLFDGLIFALCVCIFFIADLVIALFLVATVFVIGQALKLTLTMRLMPAMTADNLSLKSALKKDKEIGGSKVFFRIFANYIAVIYFVIVINVVAAFSTFGSALIISIPASFMFLICQQYVNYYTLKGKKYFITYEKIASNSDKGDREHLFEYIADTEKTETVEENAIQNTENNLNNGAV